MLESLRPPLFLAAVLVSLACARGGTDSREPRATGPSVSGELRNLTFDPTALYRQMGLIARGEPFPVVGRAAYLAGPTEDTTHVAVALSFSPSALRFTRQTDNRFQAQYTLSLVATDEAGQRVLVLETTEPVIVGSFRETERSDESILHQEIVDLPPGRYTLTLALRDVSSQRGVVEEISLSVPRLSAGRLSSPMPVNQILPRASRDSLPVLLLRPRGSAVFGQDSVLPLYVEGYGLSSGTVELLARGESGSLLWRDTLRLGRSGGLFAAVAEVEVARLGVGVSELAFVAGATDTTRTYVYIGFGAGLPVVRFDDMLGFLRFFASVQRIERLRSAPESERPSAWSTFLRETDSLPNTPEHEDLRAYFERLVRANSRFREEGTPGWLTDRGRVFLVMGEPSAIYEPTVGDFQRGRQQLWEYRDRGIQLVFYDQTGTERWRLTQNSEVRFEQEFRRNLR